MKSFPKFRFAADFFQLLSLFDAVRKSSLGKNLEQDWEIHIHKFLSRLSELIAPSYSIGLSNIHFLIHVVRICKHFGLGLASLGADSQVESYHAFIESEITKNLGKQPSMPENSFAYSDENLPPDHHKKYYLDIFARCLESSLIQKKMQIESLEHKNYGHDKIIDSVLIHTLVQNLNFKPNQELSKSKIKNLDKFSNFDQGFLDNFLSSVSK